MSVVIPVYCTFCKCRIVHDGKHWRKVPPGSSPLGQQIRIETDDHQETKKAQTCPDSPLMVKLHVPEKVNEEARRTNCFPDVSAATLESKSA